MQKSNKWSPEHPAWKYGTYDIHLAELETAAVRDWFMCAHHKTVLDVGSGSGYWAHQMFKGFDATLTDIHPTQTVPGRKLPADILAADIRALPFPDDSFDVVHARRVVSNLAPDERAGAIAEICRVARKAVLLVDVFAEPHERIQKLRESLGLPRLPRGMGAGPLEFMHPGGQPEYTPIGADYYLWTRVWLPFHLCSQLRSYGVAVPWNHPARTLYPSYNDAAKYAVHRLYVIRLQP